MPTYQYTCTDCAEQVEVVQKFTDDPMTVCPACGGKLRKVFSPVGIVFKGSGFYRTDSRKGSSSDGPAKKDKESSGAKSDSSSSSSSSSGDSGSSGSSSSGSSDSSSSKGSAASESPSAGSSDKKSTKSSAPAASS